MSTRNSEPRPSSHRCTGTKVPGTNYQVDPIRGAFNIGTQIRWLDFNDCWLAAEWGHPSDNLGAILAVADHLARQGQPLTVRDVLESMIKAHEIQGQLALLNSFNRVGLDHVVLVKVASTAVVSKLLYVYSRLHLQRWAYPEFHQWTRPCADYRRHLSSVGGRPVSSHLSPRSQHSIAQVVGCRRCLFSRS